jgi:aminopeptidase YwaD
MKKLLPLLFSLIALPALSQDMPYARKIVDTLTSPYFWGRGYTNDGIGKAATFIEGEMKSFGLVPLNSKGFLQQFSHPVNTFPGKMDVALNGKDLEPGVDYIIAGESKGVKGKGSLEQKDSVTFIDIKNRVIVKLEDKLTWSPAPEEADYTAILIDKKRVNGTPSSIKVNIENRMVKDYKVMNVAGMIKGTIKPDSLVVITAHYDHLGGMGDKTYFPGANDNASGISMLLNLAKYYAANPPKYSMVFIAFAGEEIGLLGSRHFTEHPLFKLGQVRFLVNLDLVGTGDEGVTVVNATEFKKEFEALSALNRQHNLLTAVNARGKAANSDHHWFTEKGVPSFFIYTLGGIKAYHDVFDKAHTLPLTDYADLFQLLVKFNAVL